MFKGVKSILISGRELSKVEEQYKELFDFCKQYGYEFFSYFVKILPENCLKFHYDSDIYRSANGKDYIRVEIIFRRSADFISLSKAFWKITGMDLPIPHDLNAYQILGISVVRPYDNPDNQPYKVQCMRFGMMKTGIRVYHAQIFEHGLNGHDFKTWPIFGNPYPGCSFDYLSNNHREAIDNCADTLIRNIKYYNRERFANDWYLDHMIEHHIDEIPPLL